MMNKQMIAAIGYLDDDLMERAAEDMMTVEKGKILRPGILAKGIAIAACLCLVIGGGCYVGIRYFDTTQGNTTENTGVVMPPAVTTDGLNVGFSFPDGCPSDGHFTAYRSDSSEFQLNDVTLTFYFGCDFYKDLDQVLEMLMDVREVKLYFENDDGDVYFIRETEDWYVSEEYRCILTRENMKTVRVDYNHSEVLTIPQELFTKSNGYIVFKVKGDNLIDDENMERTLNRVVIYYTVKDGYVTLSDSPIAS